MCSGLVLWIHKNSLTIIATSKASWMQPARKARDCWGCNCISKWQKMTGSSMASLVTLRVHNATGIASAVVCSTCRHSQMINCSVQCCTRCSHIERQWIQTNQAAPLAPLLPQVPLLDPPRLVDSNTISSYKIHIFVAMTLDSTCCCGTKFVLWCWQSGDHPRVWGFGKAGDGAWGVSP